MKRLESYIYEHMVYRNRAYWDVRLLNIVAELQREQLEQVLELRIVRALHGRLRLLANQARTR